MPTKKSTEKVFTNALKGKTSAPKGHAKHGRVGGAFHIRGRNKARGSFTNITTGALSTKERGYMTSGRSLNLSMQGDVGYGISTGATHHWVHQNGVMILRSNNWQITCAAGRGVE